MQLEVQVTPWPNRKIQGREREVKSSSILPHKETKKKTAKSKKAILKNALSKVTRDTARLLLARTTFNLSFIVYKVDVHDDAAPTDAPLFDISSLLYASLSVVLAIWLHAIHWYSFSSPLSLPFFSSEWLSPCSQQSLRCMPYLQRSRTYTNTAKANTLSPPPASSLFF